MRLRRDFVVTDAEQLLASARRAYLQLNPAATNAAEMVTSAADSVFTILEQAGLIGVAADAALIRYEQEGMALGGWRTQVTFDDPHPLAPGHNCFSDEDVFALPRGEGAGSSETEGWALLPGQRVCVRIVGSHQPWGVFASIVAHEHIAASIDILFQFRGLPEFELDAMFPPIGAEIDAVVTNVQRWDGRTRVRLSIRPEDLNSFARRCDFCGEPVTISPGGGGLVLEVRGNDGPGSHQLISHRECLADRLHSDSSGERARTLRLGTQDS